MRIKRGKVKKAKHNKVLKAAKGYRLSYSKLYRRAREALLHAGQYNYNHRKKRPNQFRRIWIKQINAICHTEGTKYSAFIGNLKKAGIKLDRKILGFLAVNHAPALKQIIAETK